EREGRAIDEPAARDAELPGERGQREDRADAAAAVLVSLEPVAHADRRGGERVVPLGERADVLLGHAAHARRVRNAPATCERHELADPLDGAPDERAVGPAR